METKQSTSTHWLTLPLRPGFRLITDREKTATDTTSGAISEFAQCIDAKGEDGNAQLIDVISILCAKIVRQKAKE